MPRPRRDGRPPRPTRKLNLTDRWMKRVRPTPPDRVTYWDAKMPGLGLMVTPTGHRAWKFIYSRQGRVRVLTLGRAEAFRVDEARNEAKILWGRVARGEDPAADKQQAKRPETFSEVAERYMRYAQRANKSWKQSDKLLRTLLAVWGPLRARDIGRREVREFFRSLTERGTPVLANSVLATASAVFSWAIREEVGDIRENPCRGVQRNAATSRSRVLSDQELPAFWAACDSVGLVRGTALRVLLLSGQRPGEISAMRAEHIERSGLGAWWRMPGKPDSTGWNGTKNAADHAVWLTPEVLRLLRTASSTDDLPAIGYLFPGNDKGTRPVADLHNAMRTICDALKIADRVRAHDLRRTHGTAITRLGFGREAMNRIQNHREGGIADVYDVHGYADENRSIQEGVGRHFLALIRGEPPGKVLPLRRRK
jgi:integrase